MNEKIIMLGTGSAMVTDCYTSALALEKASSLQGYQSTGLSECWRRYGLV